MVKKAAETTGISERTTIQVYQYIRDICTTKLLHTPPRLGGPGVIVQIDESLLPQGKIRRRSSGQQGTVGFWTLRHISKTSHHLYADSGQTWCWHSSTNYTKCGTTGDHHTLRPMESILPYPGKTSSRACNSQPFCQLCWSGDRRPHTNHRILLGTNQANNLCAHIAEQYPV